MNEVPWVDISVVLRDDLLTWPGNPPFEINETQAIQRGDAANVSQISLGTHTGTHIDAPRHFLAQGVGIDELPMTPFIGPTQVIRIDDPHLVTVKELSQCQLRAGERLLLRTRNSERRWYEQPFDFDFVHLTADAAEWLIEQGVQTIGIDYLSVGGYQNGVDVHRSLLAAGVCVIEGLDLLLVQPGHYFMVALPLKIAGGDAAPARVVIKPADASSLLQILGHHEAGA